MIQPPCDGLALLRAWPIISTTTNPALRIAMDSVKSRLSVYRPLLENRWVFSPMGAVTAAGLDDTVPPETRRWAEVQMRMSVQTGRSPPLFGGYGGASPDWGPHGISVSPARQRAAGRMKPALWFASPLDPSPIPVDDDCTVVSRPLNDGGTVVGIACADLRVVYQKYTDFFALWIAVEYSLELYQDAQSILVLRNIISDDDT